MRTQAVELLKIDLMPSLSKHENSSFERLRMRTKYHPHGEPVEP
jgi:hypothetical protein